MKKLLAFLIFAFFLYLSVSYWAFFKNKETENNDFIFNYISAPIYSTNGLINNFLYNVNYYYCDIINNFKTKRKIINENKLLKQEIAKNKNLINTNKLLKTQLVKLSNFVKLKNSKNKKAITIQSLGVIKNSFNYFLIIQNSNNLLKKNMVVFNSCGLIGRITETSSKIAVVLSIFDVKSKVAIKINNSNINGILKGDGNNNLYIDLLEKSDGSLINENDIKINDIVLTSGIDGVFEEGILIGKISKINKNKNILEVKAFEDLSSVDYANVIID